MRTPAVLLTTAAAVLALAAAPVLASPHSPEDDGQGIVGGHDASAPAWMAYLQVVRSDGTTEVCGGTQTGAAAERSASPPRGSAAAASAPGTGRSSGWTSPSRTAPT